MKIYDGKSATKLSGATFDTQVASSLGILQPGLSLFPGAGTVITDRFEELAKHLSALGRAAEVNFVPNAVEG